MHSTHTSLLNLLQQPNTQEAESWARFVMLYTPLFFEFARRLKVPESERQDVVQEMLVRVLKGIPQFRRQANGSFRGWLFRVLQHVWIDRKRRRQIAINEFDIELVATANLDPTALIEREEYHQYMVRQVVRWVVEEFSPDHQRLFQELVIDDQPAAEVASRFGLSLNALYLTRSRMLKRIREELSDLIDGESSR